MPLSEHEQRLLDQMERALHAEDPRLASALRSGSGRSFNGRRIAVGVLGVLAGLAGLIGGVATSLAVLGVLGFLVMLGGVLLIGSAVRAPKPGSEGAAAKRSEPTGKTRSAKQARNSSSFMSRVEDRWRRRRDGEGY